MEQNVLAPIERVVGYGVFYRYIALLCLQNYWLRLGFRLM